MSVHRVSPFRFSSRLWVHTRTTTHFWTLQTSVCQCSATEHGMQFWATSGRFHVDFVNYTSCRANVFWMQAFGCWQTMTRPVFFPTSNLAFFVSTSFYLNLEIPWLWKYTSATAGPGLQEVPGRPCNERIVRSIRRALWIHIDVCICLPFVFPKLSLWIRTLHL